MIKKRNLFCIPFCPQCSKNDSVVGSTLSIPQMEEGICYQFTCYECGKAFISCLRTMKGDTRTLDMFEDNPNVVRGYN